MSWTVVSIRKALGGKLIGTLRMRELVCQALLYLPDEVIEQVCKGVWFISSQEDAWAFTFRGSDIREAHLVFLSDELLSENTDQIIYTILHEVGHIVLNHRNSLGGYNQTEEEVRQQEIEADNFVQQYFSQ